MNMNASSVTRTRSGAGGPAALLVAALFAAGCNVGPNYERPKVESPASYRSAPPSTTRASLAEEHWSSILPDETLRELIKTGLANNYDVRIAAVRVLQAGAELGITRADQLPVLTGNAGVGGQRGRLAGSDPITVAQYQLGASVAWELDFWGKFRRATEAARAQLLGSEWGRRAVVTSLVSGIATSYFQLRALDRQLEVSQRTLATRQESLRLTQVRDQGGAGSLVDVRQAEQLVEGANATIVSLSLDIEQLENGISVLLGRYPGPIARGAALQDQAIVPEVPAGLPSSLLERRPDIQAAEQGLVAANAGIGVAKSAYFPQISLTASGGVASTSLSNLFSASSIVWQAAASLVQPIFDGGRIDAQVTRAELVRDEARLSYLKTIQQAFREVADALVEYQRQREARDVQERLVRAAADARRLADLRYQGGNSSYLEVLDSDTRLFEAELGLINAELSERAAFIEIYRALGGGWST
jgi:multidrug efflux system outer membrane protein